MSAVRTAAAPDGYPLYVFHLEDSLLPQVKRKLFVADFAQGAGQELEWKTNVPPKMHAVYSSSMLAVNSFAPWKLDPHCLPLAGLSQFDRIAFEARCPIFPRATPPHADLLAENSTSVVYVESKCLEYLSSHPARFSDRYFRMEGEARDSRYFEVMKKLRECPDSFFRHLDAAQLIKHAFGLSRIQAGRRALLLYLFWEPANYRDFSEFMRHREEAARFRELVLGDPIEFVWGSYTDLWLQWEQRSAPGWLNGHCQDLRQRYVVAV